MAGRRLESPDKKICWELIGNVKKVMKSSVKRQGKTMETLSPKGRGEVNFDNCN
jgi:hypothetical protein